MRRNRQKASSPAVSLFPFLAVLICTMGVLIVMLVLAVKSSAVHARESGERRREDVQKKRDQLLDQLDLEEYRVEKITELRPEVRQRLESEKLRRSHLNDEIRKLVQQAGVLQARFEQLELDQTMADRSLQDESVGIEALKSRIQTRREQLKSLRSELTGRPVMYSIVPTQTANGTTRRPIYVECSRSGIRLQPSGIEIRLEDFTRPIVPGNPLDAALLAIREYWNRYQAGTSAGEPYPLIVVRPGGATAYAIARRAMVSWDDEFGYELVDSAKNLDWGEADANLKKVIRETLQIAMSRQQQQVTLGQARWMGHQPRMGGGKGSLERSGAEYLGGSDGSGGPADLAGAADWRGQAAAGGDTPGQFRRESAAERSQRSQDTAEAAGSQGNASGFDTSRQDSLSRFAENRSAASGTSAARANPLRSATASGQRAGQTTGDPAALSAGAAQSLASRRGADWALPTRTPGATPYRRPIRVECSDDYYIVYPGEPGAEPVRVAVDGAVDQAIDRLVHQIWKQIESWGMAEIGGYWKPVLRLAPDESGRLRAEELARKLQGSGIEIERLWR